MIRLAADRMVRHDPVGEERGVIVDTASAARSTARSGRPCTRGFGALSAHIVTNPMLNGEVIRLGGAIRTAAG